jgi:hypothetical protein
VRDLGTIPDERCDHAVTIGLGQDSLLRWSGQQTVDPLRREALYVESFSPEQLAARRLEFMPPPPATPPAGAAPPAAPAETFDAAAFYERLREELLDAEEVGEADLEALARERAAAIAAALTAPGGLDPSRVAMAEPSPVKRKKQGSNLVASEMTVTAGD